MSDYTNLTLRFAAIPEAEIPAAVAVINDAGLGTDWGPTLPEPVTTIDVDTTYTDDVAGLMAAEEIGEALAEAAPGATFMCHTDPAYEYMGTLYIHVPGMADFTGECDADGNVHVDPADILAMFAELAPNMPLGEARAIVAERSNTITGAAHWEAFRRAAQAPATT